MSDVPAPDILDVAPLPDDVDDDCDRLRPAHGGEVADIESANMVECDHNAEYVVVYDQKVADDVPRSPSNYRACPKHTPEPSVDDAPDRGIDAVDAGEER